MVYDRYSDELLAQQDTLPTDTIFKILIGYSRSELSQAEIANNRIDGRSSGSPSKSYTSTREVRAAGRAYSLLRKWIGIKFYSDPSGLNIGQSYNVEKLFAWITEDSILEKLENEVEEFKTPKRAIEFVGYLTSKKPQEQSPAKKADDEAEDALPPIQKTTTTQPDEDVLRFSRHGDIWRVGFMETIDIRHSKGMTYILYLFLHPNKSIHCIDLQRLENPLDQAGNDPRLFDKEYREEENESFAQSSDPEAGDQGAKKLLTIINGLTTELEGIKDSNPVEADSITKEIERNRQTFNAMYDKNCKPRKNHSEAEKARKSVYKAITETKKKILKYLPELEPHLKGIKVGMVTQYTPSDQSPAMKMG
jgi:hypothetical protein